MRMHRKGAGVMQIVELTGLSWTGVNTALRLYGAGASAALVNTDVRGRSYAPVGKKFETFAVCGTCCKLSMIETVTNQKVFLILDNLRFHHSKPVKACALQNAQKIELFYLPSSSLELNPDERLNADLKHAITSNLPVRTKAKLKAAATEHMAMLEQTPERVKEYFGDPKDAYAAS